MSLHHQFFRIFRSEWTRNVLSFVLTTAQNYYMRTVLWPYKESGGVVRGLALGIIWGIGHTFNHYVVYEVLLSLNHMLSEFTVFIAIMILSYYQAPALAFSLSALLQIFGFFLVVFYGDFETPLKSHIKINSSATTLMFLVKNLKMPYFRCSNPIEKRVMKTKHFLTTGTGLYTTGFTLNSITELDKSRFRDKVKTCPAGPLYTLFTIEGDPQLNNEQKELLEYIAHHPEACFAKEVHQSHGEYWSIEEYGQLLNREIFVCRFSPQDNFNEVLMF